MRHWLLYLSIGLALGALAAAGAPASGSAAAPPLLTTTPSATTTPVAEPELAILQYVVDHNPGWMCQGPGGTPGHRQITDCYPYTVFTHSTNGYVDAYASPAAAQAAWATRRTTAQATYPIFADEDYAGYPGYHAGDTAFPYAHYENYFWGATRVLGAVSSDDTDFRGSPVVAGAIFDAAQALGYLPPNPTPTVTATPGSPVPSPTATHTAVLTAPPTGTPTHTPGPPECETFYNSSTTSCEPPGTYHYQFSYYALGCPVTRHVTVYFEVAPDQGGPWTIYDQTSFDFTFWTNSFQGSFSEPNIPAPYAWYRIGVSNVPGASWPPTTPQPICGGGATVTGTPATPTPSTSTPTPTPTTGPPCDVFNYSANLTTCDPAGHFTYDFPIVVYGSCPQTATVTLRYEIGPDSSGPWTLYDQQSYNVSLPQGSSFHIRGEFVETFVPATDPWYRIELWGLPGPAYGGIAGPARNCLVPTPMPTYPRTATPSPSPTVACAAGFVPVGGTCAPQYSDVPPTNPFYPYVECLTGRGILNGYADGTFRPYANVTRGQAAKILANAAGYTEPISPTQQTFADVPPSHPFWLPVERVALHGVISGYTCGGAGEPCDPQPRPYFRPAANLTRGQLAKIDAAAKGYTDPITPTQQTFADVPAAHPFWLAVERVALHGVISGYTCGGPGEPCDVQHRPYFRPAAAVTRGQTAKIIANTFQPGCVPPRR